MLQTTIDNHVNISGGQIVSWLIYMFQQTAVCCSDTRHAGFLLVIGAPDLLGGDESAEIFLFDASHDGHNFQQGTWAVVPLPAALPLFASGLGVMGWFARRKKRMTA